MRGSVQETLEHLEELVRTLHVEPYAVVPDVEDVLPGAGFHADLHAGNLKWWRRRLAVFDFDDAGIGVPAQDLAIAAYYLRPAQDLEQAMLAGYAELRSLPDVTPAEFEAVVASRNLVLLNDVIATEHAEFRAILPNYVANTAVKLRAYLETGVYCHDVGGLLSLSG